MNKPKAFRLLLIAASIFIGVSPFLQAQDQKYSDPARTIEANVCDEFSVVLESNQTTGFGWDISRPLDEKVAMFVGSEYIAERGGLPGSGGREVWTFRACGPGKTTIAFKYVRPWEKDVPPVKDVEFKVLVKASDQANSEAEVTKDNTK
jgi:predicted secreted protein